MAFKLGSTALAKAWLGYDLAVPGIHTGIKIVDANNVTVMDTDGLWQIMTPLASSTIPSQQPTTSSTSGDTSWYYQTTVSFTLSRTLSVLVVVHTTWDASADVNFHDVGAGVVGQTINQWTTQIGRGDCFMTSYSLSAGSYTAGLAIRNSPGATASPEAIPIYGYNLEVYRLGQ